jgi:CubicO group peptidase (beta-lactamase class C family)
MTVITPERPEAPPPHAAGGQHAVPGLSDSELHSGILEILNRRPAVGLAVSVVRDGLHEFFGDGLAEITSKMPITEDTVFRIASVTKLFTAIAVMQLWEQGRVDLDAPANDYLRAYKLVPTNASWRPVSVRHLLTHTAGIPEVVHIGDLLHRDWGPFGSRPAELSVPVGERMPSLAKYYAGGLRVTAEPGSAFQYTNHGFATLGQIVEDISGVPRARYFRERLFDPLGMTKTDLVRSQRVSSQLATGYVFGRRGPQPVPDREWICRLGAGGIYSTPRDLGRFVAALLGGGANDHGRVLEPATLGTMFEPHYQPDPRLPGRGLGFVRTDVGGHRVVGHDGLLPGFAAELLLAPDDGVGVFALTNGSPGAHDWLGIELDRLLRQLVGAPEDALRTDVPHRPEIWPELCGQYQLPAGSDLRGRVAMGRGAEVLVRGGRLMARLLTPVPALYRGFQLHPDDQDDPYVFRLDLSVFGMATVRIVFGRDVGDGVTAVHVDLPGQPLTLLKRPTSRGPGAWPNAALSALAVAAVVTAARRRRRATRGGQDMRASRRQPR